jgi:hypothetical protein
MEPEGSLPCPVLSQMNPIHILQPYFPKIYFNIIPHLCRCLSTGLFPSGFPTKQSRNSLPFMEPDGALQRSQQSARQSHYISLTPILILSSHQCLRLPSYFLHSGFPTKIIHAFLICTMRATNSSMPSPLHAPSIISADPPIKFYDTTNSPLLTIRHIFISYDLL